MTPEDWQRAKPILAKEFKSIGCSRSEFLVATVDGVLKEKRF